MQSFSIKRQIQTNWAFLCSTIFHQNSVGIYNLFDSKVDTIYYAKKRKNYFAFVRRRSPIYLSSQSPCNKVSFFNETKSEILTGLGSFEFMLVVTFTCYKKYKQFVNSKLHNPNVQLTPSLAPHSLWFQAYFGPRHISAQ